LSGPRHRTRGRGCRLKNEPVRVEHNRAGPLLKPRRSPHRPENEWARYSCSKGLALNAMLRGRSYCTLLDIGAGSGIFSKRLLQGGAASAICVDPAYREERQEIFSGKPICFLRRVGSEKCDLILLMDVLEHVDDDVGLIRSALVGAAEHAYVLISVPAF